MTKRKQDWPCGEKVRVNLDVGLPGKKTAVHSELVDEAYSMYSELLPRSRSKEQLLEWKIFGVVELATLLWMRIKTLERCKGEQTDGE